MLPVGSAGNILGLVHRWSYVTCWHIQEVECYYMVVFQRQWGREMLLKGKNFKRYIWMSIEQTERERPAVRSLTDPWTSDSLSAEWAVRGFEDMS